jgi:hypothetical protein
MPDPSPSDPTQPSGDPGSLFDTDEIRPIRVPPASGQGSASPASPSTEGYDLEGYSIPDADEPPKPVELPTSVERPKARPKPRAAPVAFEADAAPLAKGDSSEFEFEYAPVDPVWTRWGEWGSDLIRIGIAALATLILAYFMSGNVGLCLLVLALGGASTVLLSYPILITMERPVRITPEQAVKDFFAAASHHIPHYRRMWLLLSTQAREAGGFSSFEAFRDRWKDRIGRLRAGRGAGNYAPLVFEVEDFRADKSTGKSTSRADYTVHVFLRGKEDEGPIESVRMAHGLVKGPDRMWYLNRGVLEAEPGARRSGKSKSEI